MTDPGQKKFVVYTVLVGGYDQALQPLVVDERFDYVMFTDTEGERSVGVWQIRTFDYRNIDKTRESRFPKMHPEELLPGYEASLYIDANIQITGSWVYEQFFELYERGVEWGGRKHCDSLYDHTYLVLLDGLESKRKCLTWSHHLRNEKFPRKSLVFENSIIFRVHTEHVRQVNCLWWELYETFTRRDQCLLSYAFWRCPDLIIDCFVPKEQSSFDYGFARFEHGKGSGKIRFPYHSYPGYVQLRLMKKYPALSRWLNDMFFSLSACNRFVAITVVTLVSWFIFLLYAPVVYFKKYFDGKRLCRQQ